MEPVSGPACLIFHTHTDHWMVSYNDKKGKIYLFEPRHEISNMVVCATSKGSDQPALTRSLIRAFACHLNMLLVLSY